MHIFFTKLYNTKKNWVAAVTGNTKSCLKGMGKWGTKEKGVVIR
ncbi:hypothetical protein VL20_4928 [Microcystis panniformis FACHB-1757]|uniref:Uncharacterized protein n=1 Tax=Microcystis panniformis FACHB-1757 TaxID=1638788 RepID=A0A0K1S6Y1_9CHRO|nr:hypothetical protein VL20_4928 [Microcystis panniformis FACHB-1757]